TAGGWRGGFGREGGVAAGESAAARLGVGDGLVGVGHGAEELEDRAVLLADVLVRRHGGRVCLDGGASGVAARAPGDLEAGHGFHWAKRGGDRGHGGPGVGGGGATGWGGGDLRRPVSGGAGAGAVCVPRA